MCNFKYKSTITKNVPKLDLKIVANDILDKKYELSLVFIGDKLSRKLNLIYKNRDYPTNVLSFPISDGEGEIFINVRKAERESNKFNSTPRKHIIYLFIHGCLHLIGYDHGDKMEQVEQLFLKKYANI